MAIKRLVACYDRTIRLSIRDVYGQSGRLDVLFLVASPQCNQGASEVISGRKGAVVPFSKSNLEEGKGIPVVVAENDALEMPQQCLISCSDADRTVDRLELLVDQIQSLLKRFHTD